MATKVYMEALSPTMEEGRLVTWLKNEGDDVKEGDVLAEVETDKATMELVARGSGVLRKRLIGEGDTSNVGTIIAVIAGADEDISSLTGGADAAPAQAPAAAEAPAQQAAAGGGDAAQAPAAAAPPAAAPAQPAQAPTAEAQPAPQAQQGAATGADNGRVKASPLARRLAQEAGMQIGGVQGSGPGGRIVKRDIEQAVAQGGAQPAAAAPQAQQPAAEAPAAPAAQAPAPVQPSTDARYREHPLSQMRKAIARRLAQSIGPVPTFYLTVEVDMGEAMALRARINERFKDQGIKTSPNDMVIKAVAMALRKHPFVNAAWTGDSIHLYEQVHIGVAVAIEEGLITPVVRDADRKGVTEIAAEVKELAGRAREKKLKPEEFTGSTFSISNLGMFGIEEFTAIINPPEAAILAVGAVGPKVVVDDEGNMAIRQRMRVTLSCDHRVIDGATGAQFLQTLKQYLEEPMMMVA
ncbi:MAG TPA: pyruvate dehydrogenase complex dihydrolipoamide acetyltransferase [Longimicrobium sp.]|jgi:pyruvate dehydrogenase E2 component (dihydrolipoamide acetyltransferase)|uniref:pyruvate dehydrogenase complex dihydrolipoamide acetyltransferase n=1 Tax=Longimicrobium sp. TaxID=2029185 RepID=UPI002EDB828F